MESKHIVALSNELNTTIRFRGSLFQMLLEEDHRVTLVCPSGAIEDHETLARIGVIHVELKKMLPSNIRLRQEMQLLDEISKILIRLKPDRLYACGLKPVIWGAFAAAKANIPRSVGIVEGLGRPFSSTSATGVRAAQISCVRATILHLLKSAMRKLDKTIVLNVDDFARLSAIDSASEAKLSLIDGIGVDLDYFSPIPASCEKLRFTLASRLIEEKGIFLFADLASEIKAKYPHVAFRLLGKTDPQAQSLRQDVINQWVNAGILEWPGYVRDVRPHLRETSVFVLPTQYSEGLPRCIMEAMAMARPVITTDMPGARTAITHGSSGFVVPAGSLSYLSDACQKFIQQPELVRQMGSAAFHEARSRFDLVHKDTQQMEILIG